MILKNPALSKSHAGVHFSFVNGRLSAQPRSMDSVEKLFWAHGGDMFNTSRIKTRLANGHSVVLLRGRQATLPDSLPVASAIKENQQELERLGLVIAPITSALPFMPEIDDLKLDCQDLKSALAA